MPRIYSISILLFVAGLNCLMAQNMNPFQKDSIRHSQYVDNAIEKLKLRGIDRLMYFSDLNFARNDTYSVWIEGYRVKAKLISNKKFNKRIKSKMVKLSLFQRLLLKDMLERKSSDFDFLKELSCESVLTHYYFSKVRIGEKLFVVNSKCYPQLLRNNSIAPLFQLSED